MVNVKEFTRLWSNQLPGLEAENFGLPLLQLKSPNPNHVYIVIDKLFALKNALRAVEGEMGVWSDSGNNYTTRIGPHTYAYDDDDILPTSESLENFLGPSLPPYAMHARAHC